MQAKASIKIMPIACLIGILTIAFDVTAVLAPSSDIMVAVFGSTPTIDGLIQGGEWDDARTVTISVTDRANCTVYAKQNGVNLYVGFNIPDVTYNSSDSCVIIFDVDHDGSTSLQTDDIWLRVYRNGDKEEYNVTAGGWFPTTVSSWTANTSSTAGAWQSEYNITYSKLDVTAGTNKTLEIMSLIVDIDVMGYYKWPYTARFLEPVSWGDMTSNEYDWQDATPPTISILSPENKTYSLIDVSLTFTLSESTSWIGYSLDGQHNVTIAGNTTLIGLSDGLYCVDVYANDTFGNMGSDKICFTVDTTPPAISILYPQNITYPTSSVSLNFTVNETTDCTGYSLNRQGNVTIAGNTTLIGLSDGSYCVEVYANDTSGNMGSDKVCFTVDTTPPEASFSYSPETPIVNETLCFNASASYDSKGQVVSFEWDFGDGTSETEATAYHAYTKPGNYTVTLTIKDRAGHSDTKTMLVIVQEQPSISTWIIAAILIVGGVGAALLVYFIRVKKTTTKIRKWRRCPRCGTLNPLINDFCDKCGSSMRKKETEIY